MTTALALIVTGISALVAPSIQTDPAADAVCSRLLPAAALSTDAGAGWVLQNFANDAGTWRCTWHADDKSSRRTLMVGYLPSPDRGVQAYDGYMAKMARAQVPIESVPGLGDTASIVTLGTSFIVAMRKPGGFVTVAANGPAREQVLAVARRLVGVPEQVVADARAALAAALAHPPPPPPPLEDVVVRRGGKPVLCEQLLPRAELVAILGDDYHLTYANDPRPDFSTCEWRRTENDYQVAFLTHGAAEFADAKVATPAEYFATELRFSDCSRERDAAVPGLGVQAKICGQGSYFTVIVQRAKDVLVLSCPACTREQTLALARAAVK